MISRGPCQPQWFCDTKPRNYVNAENRIPPAQVIRLWCQESSVAWIFSLSVLKYFPSYSNFHAIKVNSKTGPRFLCPSTAWYSHHSPWRLLTVRCHASYTAAWSPELLIPPKHEPQYFVQLSSLNDSPASERISDCRANWSAIMG